MIKVIISTLAIIKINVVIIIQYNSYNFMSS